MLRRTGPVEAAAEGVFRQSVLAVATALLRTLFNKTLLDVGLKDAQGVVLDGERVRVDFAHLGLQDKLVQLAMDHVGVVKTVEGLGWAEKISQKAKNAAIELQRKLVETVADKLAVTGATCEPGRLVLTIDSGKSIQEA